MRRISEFEIEYKISVSIIFLRNLNSNIVKVYLQVQQ